MRPVRIGLMVAFAGSIGFSLAGMALLRAAPKAVVWAGPMLPWLMKTPTWVYMLSLPALAFALYLPGLGWRRSILLLVWGSLVGLTAELIGTSTGYPFGGYAYTDFLNPKILDHVPFLIPATWYAVSILSWELASRTTARPLPRILVGAVFMVLWDVALDPAMGAGFPVWRWESEGFFYGMPVLNLVGWLLTSLIIVGGYERLTSSRPPAAQRWTVPVWLVNGGFAIGISVVSGMWLAVAVGTVAILAPVLVTHFSPAPAPQS
jgi:putative membrane protein